VAMVVPSREKYTTMHDAGRGGGGGGAGDHSRRKRPGTGRRRDWSAHQYPVQQNSRCIRYNRTVGVSGTTDQSVYPVQQNNQH